MGKSVSLSKEAISFRNNAGIISTTLTVNNDGNIDISGMLIGDISGDNISTPMASSSVLGGVKINGNNLSIDGNGVLSVSGTPMASSSVLGGVKIDGGNLSIDGNGVLSVSGNLSQWTTSSNDIYYTTGNVGINKTNPAAKLDVKGDIRMSQLTGVNPTFTIDGNVFFLNRTNNSVAMSSYDDFYFYTGATAGRETGTNTFSMIDNNLYFNGGDHKFIQFTTPAYSMRLYSYNIANHEASVYFQTSRSNISNPTIQVSQWNGSGNLWVNFAKQSQPDHNNKLRVSGNAHASGSFINGSDDRIKHNEVDISNALTTINKLRPKKYIKTETMYDESGNYYGKNHNFSVIPNNANYEAGLIAQDISNTVPELSFVVKRNFDGSGNIRLDESGNEDILGLEYHSITSYGVKAIQELHGLVLAQASTINNLQSRIVALENG